MGNVGPLVNKLLNRVAFELYCLRYCGEMHPTVELCGSGCSLRICSKVLSNPLNSSYNNCCSEFNSVELYDDIFDSTCFFLLLLVGLINESVLNATSLFLFAFSSGSL